MLYSLAHKINLKSDLPPLETLVIPQALTKPYLSNRSNVSRHQSCENSRSKGNANNEVKSEAQKKFIQLRQWEKKWCRLVKILEGRTVVSMEAIPFDK
jgi:hypothetical protein